jgi:hypothetical protein
MDDHQTCHQKLNVFRTTKREARDRWSGAFSGKIDAKMFMWDDWLPLIVALSGRFVEVIKRLKVGSINSHSRDRHAATTDRKLPHGVGWASHVK